jgi:hypothetical protein
MLFPMVNILPMMHEVSSLLNKKENEAAITRARAGGEDRAEEGHT